MTHEIKINKILNFKTLREFLNNMFVNCPNKYFETGPRSSSLKFSIINDIKQVKGHEISELTKYALKTNKNTRFSNHMKVQLFLLERDNKSIAIEIPIWLTHKELACYNDLFKTKEVLTGHIDLVRIEDNKIWIWDYKPNAEKEKYASTQVYFYALMLSKRTNINLKEFRCGYFDEKSAFMFKPDPEIIKKNTLIEFMQ